MTLEKVFLVWKYINKCCLPKETPLTNVVYKGNGVIKGCLITVKGFIKDSLIKSAINVKYLDLLLIGKSSLFIYINIPTYK
jgi:hypothetical protein